MKFFKNINEIDKNNYYIATYDMSSSKNLKEAAWNLAIGQSVGNPNVRNEWETDDLFENHSCIILGDEHNLEISKHGEVVIAFPVVNTDWESDGISHLLCQLMGGHVDIDIVTRCRLIKLELPKTVTQHFLGPKFGLSGFRKLTGQYNKPLFGSIVKPKIGITPEVLLEMVKQMVDGGVDFIKEDEIMSNPACAPLDRRVDIIANSAVVESINAVVAVPLLAVIARVPTTDDCEGAELRTPRPKAATATSATRLKFVFVDMYFLSLVVTRNFLVAASR
jgi:ribulose-bisphosphate carboxylase large chain